MSRPIRSVVDSISGAITGAVATPVELAGCSPQYRDEITGACPSAYKMRNPTMVGFILSYALS
jgi:hypothetical protein